MRIDIESRRSIHFGVNFIFAPAPPLESPSRFEFMQHLHSEGVDFQAVNYSSKGLEFIRTENPLALNVSIVGPQVAQLLLRAEQPKTDLEMFKKEVMAVCAAYIKAWKCPAQLLMRDAAIHSLYPCKDCDHSFQYIWEYLLGEKIDAVNCFAKPLLGGGLRFIMPAHIGDIPEPMSAEVKIESYLQDSSKLFVETALRWPKAMAGNGFAPHGAELMGRVDDYIREHVQVFVTNPRKEP